MMETTPNPIDSGAAEKSMTNTKKVRARRKFRRTAAGAMALAVGLTGAGILVNAVTPDAQVATAQQDEQALIQEGKDLYDVACITCHGANLQGVKGRGPSLIGVGSGATYFQVHSGRMPMLRNEAQAKRKTPRYSEAQTLAIAAYVEANGGGPSIVYNKDGSVAMESLRGANYKDGIDPADVARGSDLFRLNCASCHNFTGRGGALSSGKYAPVLDPANEQEIYQAMLTGPQNMPKFSDRQLSADEKKDIIAYIKSAKETPSQGGWNLGGLGPVTEGMMMWLVGIVVLVAAAMWIGSRS
ncbi:c-type cytochrome [Corynebacterium belfantii]|uniref:Cytochrome bc1 complex cytochrome c subunit n=1 Tax=Corynebacterium belfantii TaxID=2014537 RepID=A0ABS0LCJ2_9CORY|nr:cytochrome c [Corynebacterium belfantii]QVI98546.1 c-type cytochrome [Corynebacterium diphtheriae]MBG9244572.1 c-type cytochrome [Corynebacterium belfantii]MBG9257969.1 c-type cytochrome [Corynebacterium belfantii]MBG9265898.1 c-type cytochrome [Corynebacterium belfantii]MBG9299297.1 c-type cytochrome [Corynebacterium belfantii]